MKFAGRRGKVSASSGIIVLVAFMECALVLGGSIWAVQLPWLLLGHVMIVGALAVRVYQASLRGDDVSDLLLALLATIAAGPLGAIGALVASLTAPPENNPSQLLEDWYERISHSTDVDEVTQFCDMVAIGRAIDLGGPMPVSFECVMEDGSLREKQNALGLIARRFHLDFIPALQAALKCDQPVIRVQAAAVAASVRDTVTQMLNDLIDRSGDVQVDQASRLELVGKIEQCLSSGLLDENDRLRGLTATQELYDLVLAKSGESTEPGISAIKKAVADTICSRSDAQAFEVQLLRRADFSAFRKFRESRPRLTRAMRRVRSMPMSVRTTQERRP